jgi:hypothetical protein
MLTGLLTLIAAALGLAGIKLWIQERAESRGHNRRAV